MKVVAEVGSRRWQILSFSPLALMGLLLTMLLEQIDAWSVFDVGHRPEFDGKDASADVGSEVKWRRWNDEFDL